MPYLTLPAICLILFVLLAATALPWLALADRISGRSRTVYYKSAGQLSLLGFWLQLILFLALGLDLLLGGTMARTFVGFWRLAMDVMLIALGASVILLLLSCLWQRSAKADRAKSWAPTFIVVLAGLHSLIAMALGSVLTWVYLQGLAPVWQPVLDLPGTWLPGLTRFSGVWIFIAYKLACLFLALAGGYVLSMLWFVLLRKRDDFGRDYYVGILSRSAGRALVMSVFLLLAAGASLALTWDWPLPYLGGLFGLGPQIMLIVFACLGLCLPLAMLCLRSISTSPLPMRKKTMIWLALLLFLLWVYSWLGRLWI